MSLWLVLVLHVVLATGCAVVGSDRSVGNWLYPVVLILLFWKRCVLSLDYCVSQNRELSETPNFGSSFLRRSFYFLSVFTLLCMLMNSRAQGITLRDMIFDLIATAAAYRQMFFSNEFNITLWLRLGELLAYVVASLGGIILSTRPTKLGRFWIVLFAFVPSAFMAVSQSSKWTLFSCIAFFYAGVLVYRVSEGKLVLLQKGSGKKLIAYAALLLAVTLASFMSRGLQNSNDQDFVKNKIEAYLASYAFGHLYGFSDWCASQLGRHHELTYENEPTSYGFYTFPTIARALGSTKVVPVGTYDDYYNFENPIQGNIFTMFRGLLQDFGVVGSLIFMFLLGVASTAFSTCF